MVFGYFVWIDIPRIISTISPFQCEDNATVTKAIQRLGDTIGKLLIRLTITSIVLCVIAFERDDLIPPYLSMDEYVRITFITEREV